MTRFQLLDAVNREGLQKLLVSNNKTASELMWSDDRYWVELEKSYRAAMKVKAQLREQQ